uniref:Uncharacterized protein n=1 Tax=viral metagenome TaxID=1070528 RepID=A0A6M3K9E1_9ZZZZ
MDKILKTILIYLSLVVGGFVILFFIITNTEGADGDFLVAGVNRGTVIGEIRSVDLTSNETISGSCRYGWISGATYTARDMTSGVSATLLSASGGENLVFYNSDDTSDSGNTIFLLFPAGDLVICETNITAGTSKIEVSGTTFEQIITCIGKGVSTWGVICKTAPTVDWQ